MIDRERAWKFAHEWLDAWNKHDVDLIMKHYADSIEFCSPVVQKVLGDPKGVVSVRAMGSDPIALFDL